MKPKIIDNFLSHHELGHLQEAMLDDDFPWYWGPRVVPDEDSNCDPLDNWQLYHPFYQPPVIKDTPYFNILSPILEKLGVRSILRIKGNLKPRSIERIQHGYHVDFPWDDSLTAIFYVNSNNGLTVFEDGTEVQSVENRIIILPVNLKHSGTTCTDAKRRELINFNYF